MSAEVRYLAEAPAENFAMSEKLPSKFTRNGPAGKCRSTFTISDASRPSPKNEANMCKHPRAAEAPVYSASGTSSVFGPSRKPPPLSATSCQVLLSRCAYRHASAYMAS